MSNLYIFKPAEKWKYCGGAIAVVANDFETAAKLLEDSERHPWSTTHPPRVYESEDQIEKTVQNWDLWVLDSIFVLEDNQPSHVAFTNYNYS